jgi:dihydroorotase
MIPKPNLKPPVTTTTAALAYKSELEAIDSSIEYLMTLYLSPELTPNEVRKAHAAGIVGVKSYPRGVTTNSDSGIESYEMYYPVFEVMEEVGMVLNLHGEVPSDAASVRGFSCSSERIYDNSTQNTCVINAEPAFLPHLRSLHARFPRLRIVLEHATTRAAVECVKSLGDTVGCTITAHHLALTIDDVVGQSWHFCKPVAKFPDDRVALQEVIREGERKSRRNSRSRNYNTRALNISYPGHPRFFLGSDSAPHSPQSKSVATPHSGCAAGVYTSPVLLPLCAHLLESFGALDKLQDFVSGFGRRFYKREVDAASAAHVTLSRTQHLTVPERWSLGQEHVVPFWAGKKIGWEIVKEQISS